MIGGKLSTETPLAYEYFKVYRDTPPGERDIRTLSQRAISGKKRSPRTVFKWSSDNNWQQRVIEWDAFQASVEIQEIIKQRRDEINRFFDRDFEIADSVQELILRALEKLKAGDNAPFNTLQLRHLAMAYQPFRDNIKELVGFMNKELDKIEEVENDTDEEESV